MAREFEPGSSGGSMDVDSDSRSLAGGSCGPFEPGGGHELHVPHRRGRCSNASGVLAVFSRELAKDRVFSAARPDDHGQNMHDSVVKVGAYAALTQAITTRSATVGVIGLGYVGLPLAMAIARAGFPTIGFDVDVAKIDKLSDGMSYIGTVNSKHLSKVVGEGHFRATSDFSELKSCDVIIICVPTPLTRYREPDLSFVRDTTRVIARHLIPNPIDQNPWAHWRSPMDMMRQG